MLADAVRVLIEHATGFPSDLSDGARHGNPASCRHPPDEPPCWRHLPSSWRRFLRHYGAVLALWGFAPAASQTDRFAMAALSAGVLAALGQWALLAAVALLVALTLLAIR